MKIKALLYCTKAKPYLQVNRCVLPTEYDRYILSKEQYYSAFGEPLDKLNGKIVIECDYEVEHIWCELFLRENPYGMKPEYKYYTETFDDITKECCLTYEQMDNYLQKKDISYAIHTKNLNIFDKPKELSEYSKRIGDDFQVLGNAPKNMMKCCELKYIIEDYILISVSPEEMCRIANKEQTILVRKNVLKEMIQND